MSDPTSIPRPMPASHQAIFDQIDNDVTWLHFLWKTYRQLFADKRDVDALNEAAGGCARIIQNAMMDDVCLSLSRLNDPVSTGKKNNLVLGQLRPVAEAANDAQVLQKFDNALADLKVATKTIFDHRNRRIAHADLAVSLDQAFLPGVSRDDIEKALEHVRDAMNALQRHYSFASTHYEGISSRGDGAAMVKVIRDGLKFHQLRKASFEGIPDAEIVERLRDRLT